MRKKLTRGSRACFSARENLASLPRYDRGSLENCYSHRVQEIEEGDSTNLIFI